jgi:hypothetical protein
MSSRRQFFKPARTSLVEVGFTSVPATSGISSLIGNSKKSFQVGMAAFIQRIHC